MSLTMSNTIYRVGYQPLMAGVFVAPFPYRYRYGWSEAETTAFCLRELRDLLVMQTAPRETAAILIEPVLGEGGYVAPTPGFLEGVQTICREHGILLIVDEAQTGVGRTGRWWAIEHWGVEPDILCTAKGIASGVPLGGIIARKSVSTWPTSAHGNTYGGNPLAAVAALATLDVLENGGIQNAAEQGDYMLARLAQMAARHPSIGDVRGKGLMIGVEFVQDKENRAQDTRIRNRIVELAFEHGLLLMGCGANSMRLIPPLVIERSQVEEGLDIFDYVIGMAEAELL